MKVGGKNQFKPGVYGGPAKPCKICGERTRNVRLDVLWHHDDLPEHGSMLHVCKDHPLPYFRPERVTAQGTFPALHIRAK
jgi:hypothetical protein